MFIKIHNFYKKNLFSDNILNIFINPFFWARYSLHKEIKKNAPHLNGDMLDIGCGKKPYKDFFSTTKYIGIDIEGSPNLADEIYDGKTIPFPNETFDSVLCTQVFEHIFTPDTFINEIARVLKPGGKLLLTVPFAWDEHEQPFDYARYSSFGINFILKNNGLKCLVQKKLCPSPLCLFQLTNTYIYKVIKSAPKPIKIAITLTIIPTINIVGAISYLLLPKNYDLFLDNAVLAEKIK